MTNADEWCELPIVHDELFRAEFGSRLSDTVYLDSTGAAIYPNSILEDTMKDLSKTLYGNPHSRNSAGDATSNIVRDAREQLLSYFGTSEDSHTVIFTAGATAGLKLVGECFPWSQSSVYTYLEENHNSILGIRKLAEQGNATIKPVSVERVEEALSSPCDDITTLFAFPGECNFSGQVYPLEWIRMAKAKGWRVCLDAACLASNSPLNLTEVPADFCVVSFYKMFGYPTGLGALLVRKDAVSILEKKYFGGGTVLMSTARTGKHVLRSEPEARFEDGTVNYLSIAAIRHGLKFLQAQGGIAHVNKYLMQLTRWTYEKMSSLHHFNGTPVCQVYGGHAGASEREGYRQGPIIAFNVLRSSGAYVGYYEVDQMAQLQGIHLRVGCHCNPGACQNSLGLSDGDVEKNYEAGHVCWDNHDLMDGRPTGCVRISFGYHSRKQDAEAFIQFLSTYFVDLEPTEAWSQKVEANREEVVLTSGSDADNTVIEKLFVYPIKSCAAVEVSDWEVGEDGLKYDREWVLVDPSGSYLNQKKEPMLSLIKPALNLEDHILEVSAPGMDTLRIPMESTTEYMRECQVCEDKCDGYSYSAATNDWFSQFLKRKCALIRKSNRRNQNNEEKKMAFANEGQFLLVNQSSLNELNGRLGEKGGKSVPIGRFRPNIVIRGSNVAAFAEDSWKSVTLGDGKHFGVDQPCARCAMICIDQVTAARTNEPLRTLASYRRQKGKVLFGILLSHSPDGRFSTFSLRTGDLVKPSSR